MDHELDNNIRRIAAMLAPVLEKHGVTRYHLEYTGGGDSTDGCTVTCEPEDITEQLDQLEFEVPYSSTQYNNTTKTWDVVHSTHMVNFESAAYEIAELCWRRAGQSGWYNNEGGFGHITLLPGGFVEFQHSNNLNDADEYEYDDDGNEISHTEVEVETEVAADWRFNILVGPIDEPNTEHHETA